MPYDNPQNRAVKREVNIINKRYVAHTDMNGMTNAINYINPAVEPEGQILSGFGHMGCIVGGGVGCADFQRSSASKHYREDKGEMSGCAILGLQDGTLAGDRTKPISSVRKFKSKVDTDNIKRFGALGDSLPSDIGLSDQNIPAARFQQGFAQKDDSPFETQPASFARSMGFPVQGSGKKRGRKPHNPCPCCTKSGKKCLCPKDMKGGASPCPCCTKSGKKCLCPKDMKGGNGFATGTHMDTGFGKTLGAEDNGGVKSTGMLDLKDTPRKKLSNDKTQTGYVGGTVLGLVKSPVEGKLDSTISEDKPAPGTTRKRTLKSTVKKELDKPVDKAQMPSSTLSGMSRPKRQASEKTKARALLVKKVCADKGMSLPQASKYIKENNLF